MPFDSKYKVNCMVLLRLYPIMTAAVVNVA